MADARELTVLVEGKTAGILQMSRTGRMRLSYLEGRSPRATPLSLSMPPAVRHHEGRAISSYLEGLLPDNEAVLARWRQEFAIRSRHPFRLIAAVGEDVAGAAQFVRGERLTDAQTGGSVQWLREAEIGRWLRRLQADPAQWHYSTTGGQFSLTGAQSKIAVLRDGERWGRPSGKVPTTHILKPAISGFADHDVNEHFCMTVARTLGIPAARTEIMEFDGQRTLVVERYDRVRMGAEWRRVHQEDLCQALGIPPERKYQSAGGPGPRAIARLLWSALTSDNARRGVQAFVDQLVFHWLVGATDAHAKNFSVLLSGPDVRLAPLYDVASALAYPDDPDLHYDDLELAMAIGRTRRLTYISSRDWKRLASDVGLAADWVLGRVTSIAERLPAALGRASDGLSGEAGTVGLPGAVVEHLHEAVAGHAERVIAQI